MRMWGGDKEELSAPVTAEKEEREYEYEPNLEGQNGECRMQMEEAALNYAQKEWKGEGKRDRPNLLITIGCHY